MMRIQKNVILSLVVILLLTGCQTFFRSDDSAIYCPKCKTVWVKERDLIGGRKIHAYRNEKKVTCPDCESVVKNFLKTREFKHKCTTCDSELVYCPIMT